MQKKIILITVFAIAMAYVESAVVVYLRAIYYPQGFDFPIVPASISAALIEIGREAATIVMLFTVSAIAFEKAITRFSAFMLAFGVWDIFYYIWLYVFLKWPENLLTWDILFLIPLPWIGPVLAPVIVSISLITAGLIILNLEDRGIRFRASAVEWVSAVAAGIIIIVSFMWDYRIVVEGTVPQKFMWGTFTAGLVLGIGVFIKAFLRSTKTVKSYR